MTSNLFSYIIGHIPSRPVVVVHIVEKIVTYVFAFSQCFYSTCVVPSVIMYAVNYVSISASDQSPLTIVSSSSPEPTLEPQGHDDITSFKTWVKFLPGSEVKERLSPEIPVICPTPVKGAYFIVFTP